MFVWVPQGLVPSVFQQFEEQKKKKNDIIKITKLYFHGIHKYTVLDNRMVAKSVFSETKSPMQQISARHATSI